MKFLVAVVLAVSVAGVSAGCINQCSGHGFCGAFDLCTCYPNWAGNDCSGRVCPQTKAWADVAILTGDAHNYATCGNKGDCEGKSGECSCYEPFEGKGCRRMACPNGCSGHGTCEYIEEAALNEKCEWDAAAQGRKTNCVDASIEGLDADASGAGDDSYSAAAMRYTAWDRNKIQLCSCDPGWSGIDCSGRICPMGNDPLRTRNAADTQLQEATVMQVQIGYTDAEDWIPTDTFVLAFTDTYNEKWYTRPIAIAAEQNADGTPNGFATAITTTSKIALQTSIYEALLDLPNAAITGTSIDPVTGVATGGAGGQTASGSAAALGVSVTGSAHAYVIDITFNSPHNSGPLWNKLECHIAGCTHTMATDDTHAVPGGCSPKYSGMTTTDRDVGCTVHTKRGTAGFGGTTNQDTCSGRGSCDGGSGLCTCYEGYTDEDCSMQTVLV